MCGWRWELLVTWTTRRIRDGFDRTVERWVPVAGSEEHLHVKGKSVTHLRSCGAMDAAIGKVLLAEGGTFRVHYLIECRVDASIDGGVSRRQLCDGLVVGLCDAQLYVNTGGRVEGSVVDTGRGEQQSITWHEHGHAIAWGLNVSTGQLVTTDNLCKAGQNDGCARYFGPLTDERQVTPRARLLGRHPTRKVTIEVTLPAKSSTDAQKHCELRRHGGDSLHPMLERNRHIIPRADTIASGGASGRARLAFSVDGGEVREASNVPRLPVGLLPWVGITRGGDRVTLVGVERAQ